MNFQSFPSYCFLLVLSVFLQSGFDSFVSSAHAQEENQVAESDNAKFDFQWTAEDEAADKLWEFKDPEAWKFTDMDGKRVLSQFQKPSSYKPPHRSPIHMALLKEEAFASFQLDVELKSTHKDYGHRDVCLYFGFQDPSKFDYVHMAKKADPHANQIFIVNRADRTKITEKTTDGTDWDEKWHHVRIIRDAKSGSIQVYFDDMDSPIMKATDKNFSEGRIGFGSFDDTAAFRKLTVRTLKDE